MIFNDLGPGCNANSIPEQILTNGKRWDINASTGISPPKTSFADSACRSNEAL
jgi:hypothetical protein